MKTWGVRYDDGYVEAGYDDYAHAARQVQREATAVEVVEVYETGSLL